MAGRNFSKSTWIGRAAIAAYFTILTASNCRCRDFIQVVEVPCAYRDRIAEITEIAAKLSAPFPFLSVDLYVLPDRIHVGEMSHFIGSCAVPFKPDAADEMIADLFNNPDAPITAARLRSAA
jgi:hypothetical protein